MPGACRLFAAKRCAPDLCCFYGRVVTRPDLYDLIFRSQDYAGEAEARG